jgi:hypothetical protein
MFMTPMFMTPSLKNKKRVKNRDFSPIQRYSYRDFDGWRKNARVSAVEDFEMCAATFGLDLAPPSSSVASYQNSTCCDHLAQDKIKRN